MSEIKFEIIKKIGVLSKSELALSAAEGSGWEKQPDPLPAYPVGHTSPIRRTRIGEENRPAFPSQSVER